MRQDTSHAQTWNHTWHEGDWEHVTLKLAKDGNFTPVAINFYQHYGGHTKTRYETWWSSTNGTNYDIFQGYSESRTHLHIWIAANSHASYNRYDNVYDFTLDWEALGIPITEADHFRDNCDYDPSGYDLYFPYDYLVKMGEIKLSPLVFNPEKQDYFYYAHDKYWLEHYEPVGSSIDWLPFVGRIGHSWEESLAGAFPTSTPSPTSPSFRIGWSTFTEEYSVFGFGNPQSTGDTFFTSGIIQWLSDLPDGDGIKGVQ